MSNAAQRRSFEQESPDLVRYASFVLRCWVGAGGQIRARLIDTQSGIDQPVADLAELPEQVWGLLTRTMPIASPESTQRHCSAE